MGIEPSKRGGRAVGLVAVAAAADRIPAKVRPHRFTDLFRRRMIKNLASPIVAHRFTDLFRRRMQSQRLRFYFPRSDLDQFCRTV